MSTRKKAEGPAAHVLRAVHRYARQEMEVKGIPGLALGLTDRTETIGTLHLGYADLCEKRPVTEDTLFEIGSIGKSFTCIALLQLAEEGKLDIQAPVTEYLPEFAVRSKFQPIRLHHLMTHSAGIVGGAMSTPEMWSEFSMLNRTEATAPPGSLFNYSNAGYEVLGLILERVAGRGLEEIITTRILEPVGMSSTSAVTAEHLRDRLAEGYEPYYDDRPMRYGGKLIQAMWIPSCSGAGAVCSTAGDMAKYVRMLLNRGRVGKRRIMSEASFRQMTKGYVKSDDPMGRALYGYGLFVERSGPRFIIGHSGSTVGYKAAMTIDMARGRGCVALWNGPWRPRDLVDFAARATDSAIEGAKVPEPPSRGSYFEVKDRGRFLGAYRSEERSFAVVARGHGLAMRCDGHVFQLQPFEEASFMCPAPGYELHPVAFRLEGRKVVGAVYGPEEFSRGRHVPEGPSKMPPKFLPFVGHYRALNPWTTNFRVFHRHGSLYFSNPVEGAEVRMTELSNGVFSLGADRRFPERLRFCDMVGGKSQSVEFSGGRFYRTFTP